MERLFNPCYEHCYLRCGKEYTPNCDSKCEFAKAILENKELKKKIDYLKYKIKVMEEMVELGAKEEDFSLLSEEFILSNFECNLLPEDVAWVIMQ